MDWQQILTDGYGRVLDIMNSVLDGLAIDDLNEQPKPDCNSIGWLCWHLTRVQDHHIAALMEEDQLWIKDKWHARFNRAAEPNDTGFHHKPEDVQAFKSPDAKTLLDYQSAVLERSKGYFSTLTPTDLDRELNEPWFQPLPTIGVRLVSVMADQLQHCGQIGYVRGLLKGKGWSKI
jgi:hypothetical protein